MTGNDGNDGSVSDTFKGLAEVLSKSEPFHPISTDESSDDGAHLDPSSQAIVMLLARCVVDGGKSYFRFVVDTGAMDDTHRLYVLLAALTRLTSDSDTQSKTAIPLSTHPNAEVQESIIGVILDSFLDDKQHARHIRRVLATNPHLFATTRPPSGRLIQRVMSTLQRSLRQGINETRKDDASFVAVSALQGWFGEAKGESEINLFVRRLVESLLEIETSTSGKDATDTVQKLCQTIGGRFRRFLLETTSVPENQYGVLVQAVANEMVRNPNRSSALVLYGTLMPQNTKTGPDRITMALDRILGLCANALAAKDRASSSIFDRLVPLLLLRRTPSTIVQTYMQDLEPTEQRVQTLASLTKAIAGLLLLLDANQTTTSSTATTNIPPMEVSPEERRLAAEIAGQVLPYSKPASCSCFHQICVPAFSRLTEAFCKKGPTNMSALKSAKLAVFASCCRLTAGCNRPPDGEAVLGTASFALWLTRQNSDDDDNHDGGTPRALFGNELVQLQTGCIEFLAGCLQSANRSSLTVKTSVPAGPVLIQECSDRETLQSDRNTKAMPRLDCMETVCTTLQKVVETKAWDFDWIRRDLEMFGLDSSVTKSPASAAMLICVWNAFLVTSQRLTVMKELERWAQVLCPWIIRWGHGGNANTTPHHQLCVAGALQTLFVVLTKTKSLNFGVSTGLTVLDTTIRTFRWALVCVRGDGTQGQPASETSKMRLAAIKLLLAIVSIDQMWSNTESTDTKTTGNLGPLELAEAGRTVSAIANIDQDTEVRKLASFLLTSIQRSGSG